MAAYAALVSLMYSMEQILNQPRLPISSLDKKQIQSVREKVDFMLDFVESYNPYGVVSKEAEDLESQIASAAQAAEDVIESHIVNQILAGSTDEREETSSSSLLDLQTVIADMDTIQEKVMKVKEEQGFKELQPCSMLAASSRPLTTEKSTMVGFDEYLTQLMDTLTGLQSKRQVIPIVGMGGIGKTTLTRNAFEHSLIVRHFDIRVWVTVSQNYSVREILLRFLANQENSDSFIAMGQDQLGEQLYKHLCGRRYLIILDDMWDIEAWDNIKFSFPDNDNGSRIVVTTRLTDVAIHFSSSYIAINFLDEDKSWSLFCEKAFGQESCPIELEESGKKIAKNCKGLPLSIVVIGGFLRKSYKSQEYWENVAKDTYSILNLEGEEQCLDLLSLSYSHLPAHLKPCFLYMGVFSEDDEIRVSRLIRLWIGEGFLKPNEAHSLEEVAEGYLKDLIDRNLILVQAWGSNGKIKACNIHDLLRELCLRIAKKEKFFYVMKFLDTPGAINQERRIVIHESMSDHEVFHAPKSASLARSLTCKGHMWSNSRLLRVLNAVDEDWDSGFLEVDFQYVNLRCLDRRFVRDLKIRITSSLPLRSLYLPRKISLFCNLQTISIKGCNARIVAPFEIWEMAQLRHLKVDILSLPDPSPSDKVDQLDDIVLQNLQTLSRVENFRLSEAVCKRIPNIKKLRTMYADLQGERQASSYYCLHNLVRLQKLESLNFYFTSRPSSWRNMLLDTTFPSSLQKLSLYKCDLYWKDLSMIGSLPNLKVLKLESDSVRGSKWNPIEGQFLRLKFLKISSCRDLIYWNADSFHFPVLEKLILELLIRLDGIPSGIGEIPTLRFIRVSNCSMSAAISAMEILEEQESLGNEDLQLQVRFWGEEQLEAFRKEMELQGCTSNNVHISQGWYF